jgi:hypothetical protein
MEILPPIRGTSTFSLHLSKDLPIPPSLRPLVPAGGAGEKKEDPKILPSYRMKLPVTEPAAIPTKKRGRPSKAEKVKAMKAKASEAVRMLIESEPKKRDVLDFLRERVEELEEL